MPNILGNSPNEYTGDYKMEVTLSGNDFVVRNDGITVKEGQATFET